MIKQKDGGYRWWTPKQEELLKAGVCEICGLSKKKMVVDHDHETNIARGVLCAPCNWGLGSFLDNPDLLRQSALYIERAIRQRLNDPQEIHRVRDRKGRMLTGKEVSFPH